MSSGDDKIVKNAMEAATLIGLCAGIGWVMNKTMKENLLGDPSANVTNYLEWTATLTGAVFLRDYLID